MKLPHTFRVEFSYDGEYWTADVIDVPNVSGRGKKPKGALKAAIRMYKSVLRQVRREERRQARRPNGAVEAGA